MTTTRKLLQASAALAAFGALAASSPALAGNTPSERALKNEVARQIKTYKSWPIASDRDVRAAVRISTRVTRVYATRHKRATAVVCVNGYVDGSGQSQVGVYSSQQICDVWLPRGARRVYAANVQRDGSLQARVILELIAPQVTP